MKPFIKKLHISNYKSITNLTVENIGAFAVFAGANGSGKSNFFDALKFVSDFVRFGITEALKMHGGWNTIHSVKLDEDNARTFCFEIHIEKPFIEEVNGKRYSHKYIGYKLDVKKLNEEQPQIEEQGWFDDELQFHRTSVPISLPPNIRIIFPSYNWRAEVESFSKSDTKDDNVQSRNYDIQWEQSALNRIPFLVDIIRALRIHRIDPDSAKIPTPQDADSSELNEKAHNLSAVLQRVEQNVELRDTIMDVMADIVPQLEYIHTDKEKYRGAHVLLFKERGTTTEFPAHLVSDGTVYALSLLIAVLDRIPYRNYWKLIEEPERGLHPHAIIELMEIFRNQANDGNSALQPVWLTTHNATLIRCCRPEELFFVEKDKAGNTIIKKPLINPNSTLPLDEAWLSNSLNGGLPW